MKTRRVSLDVTCSLTLRSMMYVLCLLTGAVAVGCDHRVGEPRACGNGLCEVASLETHDTCAADCPPVNHYRSISVRSYSYVALTDSDTLWTWGERRYTSPDEDGLTCDVDRSCTPSPRPFTFTLPAGTVEIWTNDWVRDTAGNGYWFGSLDILTPSSWIQLALPEPSVKMRAMNMGAACFLTVSGAVWCWEARPIYEFPNDWPTGYDLDGRQVDLPGPAATIDQFEAQGCAALEDGSAYCWMMNYPTFGAATGEAIPDATRIVDIAVGPDHGCVLDTDGSVGCWTHYWHEEPRPTEPVDGLPPASRIWIGHAARCALAGGDVWCWGGTLYPSSPQNFGAIGDVVDMVQSYGNVCALTAVGRIWCWGGNRYGQCGIGSTDGQAVDRPTLLPY